MAVNLVNLEGSLKIKVDLLIRMSEMDADTYPPLHVYTTRFASMGL